MVPMDTEAPHLCLKQSPLGPGVDRSFGFKKHSFISKSPCVRQLPSQASSSHIPLVLLPGRSKLLGTGRDLGPQGRFRDVESRRPFASICCPRRPASRVAWQGAKGWGVKAWAWEGEPKGQVQGPCSDCFPGQLQSCSSMSLPGAPLEGHPSTTPQPAFSPP